MKSNHDGYDWKTFLGEHPLFGELSADDITHLLDPQYSSHREFSRDSIIFRAGEIGNSFFLIGDGSVNVELSAEGSSSTIICTLYKGDYFGEMSAIDSRSGRAATILANEDCVLLEIKSKPFQQILKANPELEFELLSMLAARLRHVNDHLLQNTRLTYDTKFSLLSEKMESQSKVVDASLNASQAVFEQTKIRTTEIINAAERGRSRITWVMSTLTAGFTLLLALFSFLGYDKLNTAEQKVLEIEQARLSIVETKRKIEESKQKVDEAIESVGKLRDSVENVSGKTDQLDAAIQESAKAKRILFETLIPVFMLQVEEKISNDNPLEPGKMGRQILEINDDLVTIELLKKIYFKILDSHDEIDSGATDAEAMLNRDRISFYTSFMYLYIYQTNRGDSSNRLARFLSSYILMASYALNEDYARDNDDYIDWDPPASYPMDSIDNRLEELVDADIGDDVRRVYNLDWDFVDDLQDIEWAEATVSESRKSRIKRIWARGVN